MYTSTFQVSVAQHATKPKSLVSFTRVCARQGHQLPTLGHLLRCKFMPIPTNPAFRTCVTPTRKVECSTPRSFELIQHDTVNQHSRAERAGGSESQRFQLDSSIDLADARFPELCKRTRKLFGASNRQAVLRAVTALRGRAPESRALLDVQNRSATITAES